MLELCSPFEFPRSPFGANRRNLSTSLLSLLSPGAEQLLVHPINEAFLFQNRSGVTPVTADGQTVGLMLDAGSGTTPGPELATTTSIDGVPIGGPTFTNYSTGAPILAGRTYRVSWRVEDYDGSNTVNVVGAEGVVWLSISGVGLGANGTRVAYLTALVNTTLFLFTRSTNTANFRDISVRLMPGYPLTAVSDPARGTFRRSGRYRWIQGNGINTSYTTTALPAPGVDKGQIFAAVRSRSTSRAMIVENLGSGQGFLGIEAPQTGVANTISAFQQGANGTRQFSTATGQVAPVTAVVTGLLDLAAPSAVTQIDGLAYPANTGATGGGNFNPSGALPLTVFSRAFGSLFWDGDLYGALVTRFSGLNLSPEIVAAVKTLLAAEIAGAP